jgi:hypothetical protein
MKSRCINIARQDPEAKITAIKAAHKFFSEDKDRSFEAKVYSVLVSSQHLNTFPYLDHRGKRKTVDAAATTRKGC